MSRVWKLRTPRFSLRFLLLLPVLVAMYFFVGEMTKKYGRQQVHEFRSSKGETGGIIYSMPLVVYCAKSGFDMNVRLQLNTTRTYYLWLCGYIVELPFERNYKDQLTEKADVNEFIERRMFGR